MKVCISETLSSCPKFTEYIVEDSLIEEDGYVLIERHINVTNGYFSSDVIRTGVENAHDPSANTYCIIGALDESAYRLIGGYYDLKLIYKYSKYSLQYWNSTEDVLEWTQTSWITENNITGADLSKIPPDAWTDYREFQGLGRSQGTGSGNGLRRRLDFYYSF